ncbi:MAG: hypothetical protein IT374_03140 [Polyangiaceae bacterium]|nr:hypothetical protein [Polyangiaceae bacterium]
MRWSDVSAIQPETSAAKVMNDSDLDRGKRICASGTIAEIVAEKVGTSPAVQAAH